MPVCCEQEETSILRRIAVLLAGQQAAFAHGATTATFDRDDSARHRARERELTNLILSWVVLRQEFQRSVGFLRSSLLTEIRHAHPFVPLNHTLRFELCDSCVAESPFLMQVMMEIQVHSFLLHGIVVK